MIDTSEQISKMLEYNPDSSSMEERTSDNDDDLDNWDEELINAIAQRVGKSEKDPEGVRLSRIKLCLVEGARINAQDRNGNTALHIAVIKDYQQIVKFLREKEARIDIPNHQGYTAITLAETLRKEDIKTILKELDASDFISVTDNQEPSTSQDDIVAQEKLTTVKDDEETVKCLGSEDDTEDNISCCIISEINAPYCEKIRTYKISFKSDVEEVKNFVNTDGFDSTSRRIMELVTSSEETLLCGLKVYNTLQRIPKYAEPNSFVFIRFEDLIIPKIMDQMKTTFESPDYPDLLIIEFGSYSEVQEHPLWNLLLNIEEKNTRTKIIVISRKGCNAAIRLEINPELCIEENDQNSFNNLTDDSRRILLEKQVSKFQGHKIETSLGKLLGICDFDNLSTDELEEISEIIDSGILVELIRKDEIQIGDNLEGLGDIQEYYINRRICQRVIIKDGILKDRKIPDLFAISGMGSEPSDMMERIGGTSQIERKLKNCTILDSTKEEEQFKSLCAKNVHRNIHWLKKKSGGYIWKQSQGDITELLQHRYTIDNEIDDGNDGTDATYLSECELVAHSKPVVISDTAGMGKSTTLTYLAEKMKEKSPDTLVLKINLNHHAIALADVREKSSYDLSIVKQAIQFLVKELLRNESDLTRKVYKRIIEKRKGRVAIILDGFDEISRTHQDTVTKFLLTLTSYGIKKVIITTRPHARETLETKLNVFSYKIQPLSRDDQEHLLTKFWTARLGSRHDLTKTTEGRIEKYSKTMVNTLVDSIDDYRNKLTGNLLQTRLVAEVFENHNDGKRSKCHSCEEFMNSETDQPKMPDKIELVYLYQQFVEKEFNKFFVENNIANITIIGRSLQYHTFIEIHKTLALYVLFDKDTVKELLLSQGIESDITTTWTGIITYFIDGQPHFRHRTFAEYFAAMFLSEMLKKGEINLSVPRIWLRDILLEKNYQNMRAFIDSLVSSEQDNAFKSKFWTSYLNRNRNRLNETVFHVAAKEGNSRIIKLFLNRDREPLVHERNLHSKTAVHLAVEYEHSDELNLLIEQTEFEINSKNVEGETLLHLASMSGKLDVVKYLVEKGANVNSKSYAGLTPLHLAIITVNLDAVLKHLPYIFDSQTREGLKMKLLGTTFFSNKFELVKYLLEKGANVNCQSRDGWTPLHIAVTSGKLDIVKHLLDKGAHVNSKQQIGATPLHIAAQEGQLEIAKYLIAKKADLHSRSIRGSTPLYIAAQEGKLALVKYMIKMGANVNARSDNGNTPLHGAAQYGQLNVVKYFLDKGGNVNSQTEDCVTPLYAAAQEGQLEVVQCLLGKGAYVDSPMDDGWTPLEIAAMNGKLDVVKYLIKKGANLNSISKDGCTPLHAAAKEGRMEVVKYLLDKGVNINFQSPRCKGVTPLYAALLNGKSDIVKYLLERGAHA